MQTGRRSNPAWPPTPQNMAGQSGRSSGQSQADYGGMYASQVCFLCVVKSSFYSSSKVRPVTKVVVSGFARSANWCGRVWRRFDVGMDSVSIPERERIDSDAVTATCDSSFTAGWLPTHGIQSGYRERHGESAALARTLSSWMTI